MHITSKGQVTIPQHIREHFGLLPHSEVDFKIEQERVYLVKVMDSEKRRGEKLIQSMKGKGNVKMSTDEILKLTRE